MWDCCNCYIRLAEFLSMIVFDPFVDLFITLCIVVNTAFMALDHHDMDPGMDRTLQSGNYVSKSGNILKLNQFSVFYCHLRGGGCDEADGDEPKVLLQRGLEHL